MDGDAETKNNAMTITLPSNRSLSYALGSGGMVFWSPSTVH